jgi:hypothetical protein
VLLKEASLQKLGIHTCMVQASWQQTQHADAFEAGAHSLHNSTRMEARCC